jgi:transcriptional regulator with XRE-family HTH domain
MPAVDPRAATNLDKEIGARVRARRKQLGISQTALAEAVGVTFQQIQKYENGTNRIACSALIKIAASLEMQPSWFLGEQRGALDESIQLDTDVLAIAAAISAIKSKRVRAQALALIRALAAEG